MQKALFFDIDGTLLPHGESVIRPQVVEAIKKAQDNGALVFICTGRCYHQAKKYIDQLGTKSYICSNGQEVCVDGELIYQRVYSEKIFYETINYLKSINCPWGYETKRNIFISEGEYAIELKDVLEGYGFQDIKISDEHISDGVYQIWIFGEPQLMNEAEAGLSSDVTYYKWNENSIEIQPADENKGKGVLQVKNHYDGNMISYGFGDGVNDLEFLSIVDNSIAMDNAVDAIKEVSHFTTLSCEDDGIIHALKHYDLI